MKTKNKAVRGGEMPTQFVSPADGWEQYMTALLSSADVVQAGREWLRSVSCALHVDSGTISASNVRFRIDNGHIGGWAGFEAKHVRAWATLDRARSDFALQDLSPVEAFRYVQSNGGWLKFERSLSHYVAAAPDSAANGALVELPALKVLHDGPFPPGSEYAHYHALRFITTVDAEWEDQPTGDGVIVLARGSIVAKMTDCQNQGPLAALFAAAPNLLGAVRALYAAAVHVCGANPEMAHAYKWAASAMTKATGGARVAVPEAPASAGEVGADVLADMRDWLKDCSWADVGSEEIEQMSEAECRAAVERHFEGGFSAFLQSR